VRGESRRLIAAYDLGSGIRKLISVTSPDSGEIEAVETLDRRELRLLDPALDGLTRA